MSCRFCSIASFRVRPASERRSPEPMRGASGGMGYGRGLPPQGTIPGVRVASARRSSDFRPIPLSLGTAGLQNSLPHDTRTHRFGERAYQDTTLQGSPMRATGAAGRRETRRTSLQSQMSAGLAAIPSLLEPGPLPGRNQEHGGADQQACREKTKCDRCIDRNSDEQRATNEARPRD